MERGRLPAGVQAGAMVCQLGRALGRRGPGPHDLLQRDARAEAQLLLDRGRRGVALRRRRVGVVVLQLHLTAAAAAARRSLSFG